MGFEPQIYLVTASLDWSQLMTKACLRVSAVSALAQPCGGTPQPHSLGRVVRSVLACPLPSPPLSRPPPVFHPHLLQTGAPVLSQRHTLCSPGTSLASPPPCSASPSPRAWEGTVGAEIEPQCSIHCCIMTLFMSWAENSVGKQCNSFYEDSSPPGQGLGRIPTPDPTWHRFQWGSWLYNHCGHRRSTRIRVSGTRVVRSPGTRTASSASPV